MPTRATIQRTFQVAGRNFTDNLSLAGSANFSASVSPATAKQGLTSGLSSGAFTVTMAAGGHGITTGAKVDVYWTASGKKRRYNMTVGTVSGNTVPITASGAGDAAPADGTTVFLAKPTNVPVSLVGDNAEVVAAGAIAGSTDDDVTITFLDDAGAALSSTTLDAANGVIYGWDSSGGVTNPLAGATVASVAVSSRSATRTSTVEVGIMF